MCPRILVTEPIPEKPLAALRELGEVEVGKKGHYQNKTALVEDIPGYDALLCMLSNPVDREVIEAGRQLKVIANFAVGYNNIDVDAAADQGIRVANTPDVLTEACGDFAMGLLLATTRRFYEAERYLREGHFKGWEPLGFLGMQLSGRKLGIVGMGRIGQSFARRAAAFGMEIHYHNRTPVDSHTQKELQAHYHSDLRELIAQSDVLSLNCPLTPETHHLINGEMLALMPSHAILINISRGPVVDEAELASALHNGQIGGAGLDVFEREPEIHPDLLTAPNCTLLPHIASATNETRTAIGDLAVSAIRSVLQGTPDAEIPNLVVR